jgi:hypothetical protein
MLVHAPLALGREQLARSTINWAISISGLGQIGGSGAAGLFTQVSGTGTDHSCRLLGRLPGGCSLGGFVARIE